MQEAVEKVQQEAEKLEMLQQGPLNSPIMSGTTF
jgi:hypothetical protein